VVRPERDIIKNEDHLPFKGTGRGGMERNQFVVQRGMNYWAKHGGKGKKVWKGDEETEKLETRIRKCGGEGRPKYHRLGATEGLSGMAGKKWNRFWQSCWPPDGGRENGWELLKR